MTPSVMSAATTTDGLKVSARGGWLASFGLGAIFAIFYFLMIRPQQKRQKQTREMLASLKKGDTVSLVGFGTFKSAKRAARTGVNPKTGEVILESGSEIGTAMGDAAGAWSFATGTLGDGAYGFTAMAVDAAGNRATATRTVMVRDTTPPATPCSCSRARSWWAPSRTVSSTRACSSRPAPR